MRGEEFYIGVNGREMRACGERIGREVQYLYRIDEELRLLQVGNPPDVSLRRGHILCVDGLGFGGSGKGSGAVTRSVSSMVERLMGQVSCYGYVGICCFFPRVRGGFYHELVRSLDVVCGERGLDLLVGECYGGDVKWGKVLISTALSGGTLEGRFSQAVGKYGGGRVVMEVEWMGEDFLLPAPSGSGERLSPEEVRGLRERVGADVFFSHELCGKYFTYQNRAHSLRFVLFDDGETVGEKIRLAEVWKLGGVFLNWSEVKGEGELLI